MKIDDLVRMIERGKAKRQSLRERERDKNRKEAVSKQRDSTVDPDHQQFLFQMLT